MTTTTTREKTTLEKLKIVSMNGDIMHDAIVLALIETLVKEAEESMKQKCLACIPENKDLWWTFTTITHNLLATWIRDYISSI